MATTKVTANVLADNSVTQAKLADDAVGADELAANAVVNASIAPGAAIDMDKLDGDSLANAITDFAQDDLVILSDTSDSGNLAKITTSNFEDAIFGNISGDVTLAGGGAATLAAAQTNITSVLNTSLILGRDADNQIKFGTDNQIIFEVDGGDNVIFKASGEIEASSLDISGDVDVDGTLEADAITINGTTLAETISDTVGAMVGSNTETGIAVTYDDSDNTLDFVIGSGVIASSMIAGDAIDGSKIADDAVDSEHYTDGSIDTAHIADNNVTFDKLENRYTAKATTSSTSGTISIDWSAATTFEFTASLTGATTISFTNFKQGQTIGIYGLTGSQTITLDSNAATSETFNKVGGVDYDGASSNYLQIVCVDDSADAVFNYSVATYTSDTTI